MPVPKPAERAMRATREGRCRACGTEIIVGDTIRYSRTTGTRHNDCRGMDRRQAARADYRARHP